MDGISRIRADFDTCSKYISNNLEALDMVFKENSLVKGWNAQLEGNWEGDDFRAYSQGIEDSINYLDTQVKKLIDALHVTQNALKRKRDLMIQNEMKGRQVTNVTNA